MSFLLGKVDPSKENRYLALGYSRNPFPPQGHVMSPAVYVPRPELSEFQQDFLSFLSGRRLGRVWALSGRQGVGKSNFLRMLNEQLGAVLLNGEVKNTGVHMFDGNAWSPSHLIAGVTTAIGHANVEKLIQSIPTVAPDVADTDFGKFWISGGAPIAPGAASEFLLRWLGGGQTFVAERSVYGISARDRLTAAVAVPYLRVLLDMLEQKKILSRIVLLFDELENVQTIKRAEQQEYLQLLKTLLNAFNWEGLYVVLAGAPSVFEYVKTALPSLAQRWNLVALSAIRNSDDALAIAESYREAAKLSPETAAPFPTPVEIRAVYVDLAQESRGPVVQRAFLSRLHDVVEREANSQQTQFPFGKKK